VSQKGCFNVVGRPLYRPCPSWRSHKGGGLAGDRRARGQRGHTNLVVRAPRGNYASVCTFLWPTHISKSLLITCAPQSRQIT